MKLDNLKAVVHDESKRALLSAIILSSPRWNNNHIA